MVTMCPAVRLTRLPLSGSHQLRRAGRRLAAGVSRGTRGIGSVRMT